MNFENRLTFGGSYGQEFSVLFFLTHGVYCLLIVCFPTYPFFLHFFLTYLLPYLSFPLRIDALRFQAGCRKRRLNLALVFVFILCCMIGKCVLFVIGLVFFTPSQGLGKRLRNDLFCVEWNVKPQLD